MQSQATIRLPEEHGEPAVSRTRRFTWTIGNLLMLVGLYVLLFVGGLMADEQYNVYAASGDTDVELPTAIVETVPPPAAADEPTEASQPAEASQPVASDPPAPSVSGPSRFDIPFLNSGGSELTNVVPTRIGSNEASTISRIVITALALDKKVVEVGWTMQQAENGQPIAVWDVDKYRVGHHQGSSNPGGGSNIVLTGHSGGAAYPFNDIYWLEPGHVIELTSNDQVYEYVVTERLVVDEDGQPLEKRIENARYIEPTDEEVVTLVTCWPLTDQPGIPKFTQRVIVRAAPGTPTANVAQPDTADGEMNNWIAR